MGGLSCLCSFIAVLQDVLGPPLLPEVVCTPFVRGSYWGGTVPCGSSLQTTSELRLSAGWAQCLTHWGGVAFLTGLRCCPPLLSPLRQAGVAWANSLLLLVDRSCEEQSGDGNTQKQSTSLPASVNK